ncbi:dephospho-CoA kinase [Malikia sp.]|uniref:dephospho-CoA kinase n=1 Tax=Malikia sp. TaxID=2070706 RepID=UPI002627E4CB|nr:dephospho-CoA kinase [Malikia sp.]MDD2727685.1 dephospho-CoA kinase [Malikia sp.]
MKQHVVRLGLTGGIGSGKSTVAATLAELGAVVIDADAISRASTTAGGIAVEAIRAAFGDEFVTAEHAMDRERMRARVFTDPAAKARLEGIVHPIVRAEIDRQVAAMTKGIAVLDLPLLAESPAWRQRCDLVWVVDCDPETQIRRVMRRNGWPRAQVEQVLAAQASRAQRLAIADGVIANDGVTLAELRATVGQRWDELRQRFGL